MTYAPTNGQVDRGARTLGKARGLVWEQMPEDWRKEHRRQAIAVLMAAMTEPGAAAPAPAPATAADELDLDAEGPPLA